MRKLLLNLRACLPAAPRLAMTWLMRILAWYVIPAGIVLISALALLTWHDQYSFSDNLPLNLRIVSQGALPVPTPGAALAALRSAAPVGVYSTHLADTPFWFSVDTVHRVSGPEVIEFPSRHAVDIACWDTAGMTFLGAASRGSVNLSDFQAMVPAKAGFALRLTFMPAQLLCRSTFAGPARLSVIQWPAGQFALSIDQYHRKSGLLDGGMIVLALFVLISAAIYREMLYVVFAGWLMVNLRLGATSAGWDVQWLGQQVPPDWLATGRSITVILYAVLTMALYQMLLRDYLVQLRHRLALGFVQWMCLPTLMAAFLLPYRVFVPILWVIIVLGIAVVTIDLVRIMISARTRVALYFTAGLVISFAAGVSEIVAGALDLRELHGAVDSVTAALASSLLAALAVAEQMRIERERRVTSQSQFRQSWDAVPAGLFTLDLEGRFLAGNPALKELLGVAVGDGASHWRDFFAGDAWYRLRTLVDAGQVAELEIVHAALGRRFIVRATLAGERIEGVLKNITEQSREVGQLRLLAHRDPLTGVFNRRGMEQVFESAAGALAAGRPMALAFLDLDRFKIVNDVFGRTAGDEVLRQACERIAGVLAGGQHLGRIGGDAFVIAMPDTGMDVAALLCRAIVERVGNTPYLVGDKACKVRASMGLVEVAPGMRMTDAIDSADRACREAKAAAGDGVVAHGRDASAVEEQEAELKLIARLSSPNATEGMYLVMQPVVALAAPHESLSVEVQLRLRDAGGALVDARRIVAAAEKSGRAGVIDRWVLANTLDWIERHAGQVPPAHFVYMSLSSAALNDEQFVQNVLASLRRYAHVAARLCLGMPERVALQDIEQTRRFIERVHVFGVKIALDQFGTGASPFAYLKTLSVDLIKIDATFTDAMGNPANAAIVDAMVGLAKNFGMKTIAAGVHDGAAMRALARAGVDYVQGDAALLSQPLAALLALQSSAAFVSGAAVPARLS